MHEGCDVCQNFRPEANLRERVLSALTFGEHIVVLCEMHRRIARRSGVTTFEGLREHFGEPEGRRSYVPRRSRVPYGSPGDDRRDGGRRASDL